MKVRRALCGRHPDPVAAEPRRQFPKGEWAALERGVYGVLLELRLSSAHDLDRVQDRPAIVLDGRALSTRLLTEGRRGPPRIASPEPRRHGSLAAKAQRFRPA